MRYHLTLLALGLAACEEPSAPAESSRTPGKNFRPIAPGASVEDTLHISGVAYAGLWRFQLDIRDVEGDLLPLEQRVSAPFEVLE